MTDLRKAAEMALEALEQSVSAMRGLYGGWRCTTALKESDKAITALRQALEQPSNIEAAIRAENEACAKASEFQIERWVDDRARYAAGECAAAIRERMK